jgi:hypothetical protein
MSFTDIFGGTTVYSSDVSYRAVALTANVTLDWPTETAPTGNVVSAIMDVTPSSAGFIIRMPAANKASVGETALFFNVGANSFIVADNGGNTIVTIAAGQAWQVYLTSNTTVNGTWRSNQYGVGTSVATAGSLIGAGIKAIGTTLNQAMSATTLNTNYTAGEPDRSEVFNWTGGAGTFSLPSSSVVGNDWFLHLRNSGTGGLTVATTVGGQNVNGGATLMLNPGDSSILFCDGGNYFTIGLGKSASFAFDFVSISLTGQPSPYILAGANLNRVAYRFTGNITGNVQIVVPSTVQQYWVTNGTDLASAPYTIEVKTLAGLGVTLSRDQRAILFCDGTNVLDADTAGISSPLSVAQGGTGATTDSGARINLGATSVGNALFTAADGAAARTAIGAVNIAGDTMTGALTLPAVTVTRTTVSTLTSQLSNVDNEFQLSVFNGATSGASGTVKATFGLYYLGSSLNGGIQFTRGSDGVTGWMNFLTSGTERMRITSAGEVGIGTPSPNASAILDVQSTVKGVRFPNMTTAQKNAIATPAAGLVIFDTTLAKLCVYTGAAWQTITSA